jgi:hexulose-6-phosphate isomerase
MSQSFSRRDLLKTAAALPMATLIEPSKARAGDPSEQAAAGQATPALTPVRIKRAVLVSMLPEKLSWKERFALAKDIGFEGIEMQTMEDQSAAEEVARASQETGLVIHSVMNMAHWKYPISSPDPEVVRKSVAGMKTSLTNASLWKAEIVLLVPAVVNPATSYADAWARSTQVIKEQLVPLADGFKVKIGIEEVWNKFLLSPLEFNRYIDEFRSPWIKAYMDVGNVVLYGYPQDWIRTLGKRISRLHLKDFRVDRESGKFEWKNIGEGDIDWQAVRAALADAPFATWCTTELEGGDRAYLADVLARVDRFLGGFKPHSA